MKRGTFIFDGVESEEIHALIQSRPLIEAPLRKVEWRSTYGVDGDVPFDEGAYGNTKMELVLLIDGKDVIADRQKIYNLMDSRGVYKDFIPYFDPTKIYRVMINDKIQFEHKHHFGTVQLASVKLTVKPYKYLVDNDPIVLSGLSGVINNPTNYASQPIIKIEGTGAVKITINGVDYNIKNASNSITINSEIYSAYQEDAYGVLTPMNNQVTFREFPIFKPGKNEISITGAVTKVTIEPRWRSLV